MPPFGSNPLRVIPYPHADKPATVDDLITMLQRIKSIGYGHAPVLRHDCEAGPCALTFASLNNDSAAYLRGETPASVTVLLG
jgi:hypothetical protein